MFVRIVRVKPHPIIRYLKAQLASVLVQGERRFNGVGMANRIAHCFAGDMEQLCGLPGIKAFRGRIVDI